MPPKIAVQTEYKIVDRYLAGEKVELLAQSLGISRATVHNVVKRQAILPRKRLHQGGASNSNWRGGRQYHAKGYIKIWVSPTHKYAHLRHKDGCIFEHRLVMMDHLNRELTAAETVHHINGNKQDNRPQNLQLMQGNHGPGASLCCGDCGSLNIVASRKGM